MNLRKPRQIMLKTFPKGAGSCCAWCLKAQGGGGGFGQKGLGQRGRVYSFCCPFLNYLYAVAKGGKILREQQLSKLPGYILCSLRNANVTPIDSKIDISEPALIELLTT